jgi:glycosyltransferase involved in cell wall biosynthesis
MRALAVVPVFDEAATIGAVVRQARRFTPVLVVDDGSHDGSGALAEAAGAEVIRHPRRLGKGQAIRTAVAAARARGAQAIVTLDGDGQHDPSDLAALLAAAETAPGAVVIGARRPEALPAVRRGANRLAGFVLNRLTGLALRDTQSGFRAYPLALFEAIDARRGGFVFETEALVAAAAAGFTVVEVPVATIPRAGRRSRFRPLADGLAIAGYLGGAMVRRLAAEAIAVTRRARDAVAVPAPPR